MLRHTLFFAFSLLLPLICNKIIGMLPLICNKNMRLLPLISNKIVIFALSKCMLYV